MSFPRSAFFKQTRIREDFNQTKRTHDFMQEMWVAVAAVSANKVGLLPKRLFISQN